jgi:hypothetical protein
MNPDNEEEENDEFLSERDTTMCHDQDDTRSCHCNNCMDCLGMSERDFF